MIPRQWDKVGEPPHAGKIPIVSDLAIIVGRWTPAHGEDTRSTSRQSSKR